MLWVLYIIRSTKMSTHFISKYYVLTNEGSEKRLALEWGSGEPAIAIAIEGLMVLLSGSESSKTTEACLAR